MIYVNMSGSGICIKYNDFNYLCLSQGADDRLLALSAEQSLIWMKYLFSMFEIMFSAKQSVVYG